MQKGVSRDEARKIAEQVVRSAYVHVRLEDRQGNVLTEKKVRLKIGESDGSVLVLRLVPDEGGSD